MKKLLETKPILHAVIWVIIYIATITIGDALSETTGTGSYAIPSVLLIILSFILLRYLIKTKRFLVYGMKWASKADSRKAIFYAPLILIAATQYLAGLDISLSRTEILLICVFMIGVGFIEELLFRGFLYQGIVEKSGINRAALISGITFGLGHIVNLFRGTSPIEQTGQIMIAIV